MNNKNTIVAVCLALLLMIMLFACSRGCRKPKETKINTQGSVQTSKNVTDQKESGVAYVPDYSAPSRSYSAPSRGLSYYCESEGTPPALLTEQDKEEIKKRKAKSREKLRENARIWLQTKTNDPSFNIKTIEKYKIRSDQNFANGTMAYRKKDYAQAIKFFNETVKDKKTSPVTKYFAISNLMNIAQDINDFELFFIAARMNASLCATEDLTVIGIEKSTHQLEWVEKVEKTLKAIKDKRYFEECVQAKLNFYKGGIDREGAEEEVREDMAFYGEMYKELLK